MSYKPRCYNIKISNVAYFEFILAARVLMSPLILRGFFLEPTFFPGFSGTTYSKAWFYFSTSFVGSFFLFVVGWKRHPSNEFALYSVRTGEA